MEPYLQVVADTRHFHQDDAGNNALLLESEFEAMKVQFQGLDTCRDRFLTSSQLKDLPAIGMKRLKTSLVETLRQLDR